ncbi:hypothetical protein LTR01_007955 [Friedmanniomyces endolithicus]|nr:hypothetical protein LTR01_007955 [Friedmanniomyces endolithicus]KAK0823680.1 hypothetical protein LTR73_008373 [Friedmanniomyces endolithicus]
MRSADARQYNRPPSSGTERSIRHSGQAYDYEDLRMNAPGLCETRRIYRRVERRAGLESEAIGFEAQLTREHAAEVAIGLDPSDVVVA